MPERGILAVIVTIFNIGKIFSRGTYKPKYLFFILKSVCVILYRDNFMTRGVFESIMYSVFRGESLVFARTCANLSQRNP